MIKKNTILTLCTLVCAAVTNIAYSQSADSTKNNIVEYRRSSLYTVLIKHPTAHYGNTIDSVFMSMPVPDKFNNHDIDIKSFPSTATKSKRRGRLKEEANEKDISEFILNNDIPKRLVAKWFNRDSTTGAFNMNLIYERGFYDASQNQINIAENSLYGKSLLADAGVELIGNTFILINDITFSDTGKKTAKAAFWMKLGGSALGSSTLSTTADVVNDIDGFGVNITSYLYKLEWNQATLEHFYENMWHEAASHDPLKQHCFDTTVIFKVRKIGSTITTAGNMASKTFTSRSKEAQLTKVCARAIDKSIVELQREFDEFKVNVPISTVHADGVIDVPIGLKEGLNHKSEYEVLMPVEGDDKKITYKTVGRIKPIKGKIWDNRYGALDDYNDLKKSGEKVEDPDGKEGDPTLTTSSFKALSGKHNIVNGCLVREVTIKR